MAILNSNKAINAIKGLTGEFTGGLTGTYKYMTEGIKKAAMGTENVANRLPVPLVKQKLDFMDAVKEAHKAAPGEMSVGGYSAKKIAGSYIGVSAGARVATGGGLYKDRDGNTDVIGIPFI
jgi:hypothetical protein